MGTGGGSMRLERYLTVPDVTGILRCDYDLIILRRVRRKWVTFKAKTEWMLEEEKAAGYLSH